MSKCALICGISGQDGAYLAAELLHRGYYVVGTSRDAEACSFQNLRALGIFEKVHVVSMVLTDISNVLKTIAKFRPDEIYNLAGQTSVAMSFSQPAEALQSIALGVLNLLEAIRLTSLPIRLYNACSSECFGDTGALRADESIPFRPRSPYAVAKAAAYWQTVNYREAYGIFACSGILFNHESPLRHERFVIQKLVLGVDRILTGEDSKLHMGDLSVVRDWGWAPEYVKAMWMMLQQNEPEDFVIATGESHSLEDVVNYAFSRVGLDWRNFLVTDGILVRPTDISRSYSNPSKAAIKLGWRATVRINEIIDRMAQCVTQRRLNEEG